MSHLNRSSVAARSQLDCTAIVARLRRDRGAAELRSWLLHGKIVAHDLPTIVDHDFGEIVATNRPTTASNGPQNLAEIPL